MFGVPEMLAPVYPDERSPGRSPTREAVRQPDDPPPPRPIRLLGHAGMRWLCDVKCFTTAIYEPKAANRKGPSPLRHES